MSAPFPYAGEALALASSVLWAGAGVVFARVRADVAPGALNLGKNLTALLLFGGLFLVLHGTPWPRAMDARAALLFAASGFVGLVLCDTFFLRALRTIGPQRATLFLAAAPVLTTLGALLPPFSETPPPAAWVGMAFCVSGVFLAARGRPTGNQDPAIRRRGVRDGLLGALFQAAGMLLSRQAFEYGEPDAAAGTAIRLATGTAGLLLFGFALGRAGPWLRSLARGRAWVAVASAASFGTFLGIWAHTAGLGWARHAGVAATLNSLAPVFLIPLSALFLHERFDRRAWVATALALLGVALLSV